MLNVEENIAMTEMSAPEDYKYTSDDLMNFSRIHLTMSRYTKLHGFQKHYPILI